MHFEEVNCSEVGSEAVIEYMAEDEEAVLMSSKYLLAGMKSQRCLSTLRFYYSRQWFPSRNNDSRNRTASKAENSYYSETGRNRNTNSRAGLSQF